MKMALQAKTRTKNKALQKKGSEESDLRFGLGGSPCQNVPVIFEAGNTDSLLQNLLCLSVTMQTLHPFPRFHESSTLLTGPPNIHYYQAPLINSNAQ